MRAREAIRLFFDAWDEKLPAAGCKAILTAEIHATGSIGRRSLTPGHKLPSAVRPDSCGPEEKGPGPG
jgi:hypothetical protein